MKKRRPLHEIMMNKSQRQLDAEAEQSQQEFSHRQRANWSRLVPEIAFVLLRCGAYRQRVFTNEIVDEAAATYPGDFDGPLVLLTLFEAKRREWGYAAGNWFRGWRLTKKGLAFARDVERRKSERKNRRR